MAVLVEALSVIVRRDAIESRFSGGWPKFLSSIPNSTLCLGARQGSCRLGHAANG